MEKIGLIGYGTVGKALYAQIQKLPKFAVAKVVVKNPEKHTDVSKELITQDAFAVIEDESISIILEAINDHESALKYALATLKLGKTYISASKKMVAENLAALINAEQKYGGTLLYEAAVCGAIPILRTIREHFSFEPIETVRGILNGSTNYILSKMEDDNLSFDKALSSAQDLGFAESNPDSDVDGIDSYFKAIIIASTLFGGNPIVKRVVTEGIRDVGVEDIESARNSAQRIKLVTTIRREEDSFFIDTRPTLLTSSDPLFYVGGVSNGVEISGGHSGAILLQGAGAGGAATASAMIGDLVNAPTHQMKRVQNFIYALG